jgi:hypothetical protein
VIRSSTIAAETIEGTARIKAKTKIKKARINNSIFFEPRKNGPGSIIYYGYPARYAAAHHPYVYGDLGA